MAEEYIPYFVAVILFVIGFLFGRGTEKRILNAIVKALNINRELGEGTEQNQRLFIEKGKVKGSMTVSFTAETDASIVDFENKKEYTPDGVIELTDERIKELRALPQFRKTAI